MTTYANRIVICLFAILMIPSMALAQNKPMAATTDLAPKDMIAIYGHGNSRCSDFMDYSMRGQDIVIKNYQVWLNGFISAYNTLVSPTGNVAKSKKSEELVAWVQNYCRQNPTSYFQRATIELLRAMESGEF